MIRDWPGRAAILSFEKAVSYEDAMTYDEPEPLPFAARHWLGAANACPRIDIAFTSTQIGWSAFRPSSNVAA